MAGKRKGKRDLAVLVARSRNGEEVERQEWPLDRYYDQLHEMMDSDEYRARRGIASIEGQLFDESGKLLQEFRNRYSDQGRYEGGRTVHADGTVNED